MHSLTYHHIHQHPESQASLHTGALAPPAAPRGPISPHTGNMRPSRLGSARSLSALGRGREGAARSSTTISACVPALKPQIPGADPHLLPSRELHVFRHPKRRVSVHSAVTCRAAQVDFTALEVRLPQSCDPPNSAPAPGPCVARKHFLPLLNTSQRKNSPRKNKGCLCVLGFSRGCDSTSEHAGGTD